jgi:hypothetical protein
LSRDIDHQLELRGLLNRQFRRIRALQNFVDENCGPLEIMYSQVRIGDQTA